jgi:hypothetical protein
LVPLVAPPQSHITDDELASAVGDLFVKNFVPEGIVVKI